MQCLLHEVSAFPQHVALVPYLLWLIIDLPSYWASSQRVESDVEVFHKMNLWSIQQDMQMNFLNIIDTSIGNILNWDQCSQWPRLFGFNGRSMIMPSHAMHDIHHPWSTSNDANAQFQTSILIENSSEYNIHSYLTTNMVHKF